MMTEIYAALTTPLTSPTGPIDAAYLARHLRWLEDKGLDGVVPGGTTGEGPSLTVAERMQLIDLVLANCGELKVIPGTGCAALNDTIALTRHAIDAGCDAALVLPPFFIKNPSEAGLIAFYRAVCDALPPHAKLVLYHIPPMSAVAITPGLIDALYASHPQMVYGLKDSGGDAANTAMLTARFPELRVFTGAAPLFARALADGAAGGIFAIANAFPRELRAVADAHAAGGDVAAAQTRVAAISDAIKGYGNVGALKALLPEIVGLPQIASRPPIISIQGEPAAALWGQIAPLMG